ERLPKVVSVSLIGRSGMQGHTDFEHQVAADPGFDALKVLLCGEGGFQGFWCGGEGSAEGIPDGLEDGPAIGFGSGTQQGIMTCQGQTHGVGLLLPESGRAFNIGEKKSDGSCWEIRHKKRSP